MSGTQAKATGGCLCGAIRFEAQGQPLGVGTCHCRSCQQQTGSAYWVGVRFPVDEVRWLGNEPDYFETSEPISEFDGRLNHMHRGFCSKCGSTVACFYPESPFPGLTNTISLALGLFDDPHRWKPVYHYAEENQLEWTKFDDGIERMRLKPQ